MSDLAAWAGRVFAMTLTTVTRIEGGSAQTSRPAQLGEARADARSGTVPPTPGNRALGRRRRSDVGGAFEHIANAARIPSRRASAIGLDSEAGSAVLRRVLMPELVATAGGGLTCDAQVGSDS